MMATTSQKEKRTEKTERLEARITRRQKELFQRAAAVSGRSLTDFVVNAVQEAAIETIKNHQMNEMSARNPEMFVAALLNPPEPNEALRAAFKQHRDLVGG